MSTLTAEAAASGRSRRSGDTLGWWRNGVIYQVYVRSFQDSDGDGIGDLEGVRARLPSLRSLGVFGIWLDPFYASPQHDHGRPGVLAFRRGDGLACVINFSPRPACAPPGSRRLLGSDPEVGDKLPPDSAGWFLPEAAS